MTEMIVPNGHQIAVYESCNQSTFLMLKHYVRPNLQ